MVGNKNNKINLYTDPDKDKFVNKKIGEFFPNLEDQIYKIIKDKIIWHEIKMGERIIDKKLAEELGVSRSMVRQVLTTLVKEELLTMVPRIGFYLKEISKKEIGEIYDVRKVLEAYAIELAVARISVDDFEKMEKAFYRAKKDLSEGKSESFIKVDLQMHKLFIDNCGNEHLKRITNKYSDRYNFYRISDLTPIKRAKKSYFEHLEILKAAKNRDSKISSKLMIKHIEHCKNEIINNFDKYTYEDSV